MSKKWIVVLAVCAVSAAGIWYLVSAGDYPALIVNSEPISYSEVSADLASVMHYYTAISNQGNNGGSADISASKPEIEKAVLDKLVEDVLVSQELSHRFNQSDIQNMVQAKISEALKGVNIEKGVQALYGLSLDDFRSELLEPQAKEEILQGRMILESHTSSSDGGFADWLNQERSNARVFILIPSFSWNGQQVIISK